MLSNTAVPRYYGALREEVRAGRIPVCEEIDLQMHRIDAKIEDPALWNDDAVVEGFIAYCEAELTLTDGSDLHLLDSFKLWAEDIFGWYYFVEQLVPVPNEDGSRVRYERRQVRKRLCNKQYLIVSRGAAKTMYASCLQSYFLVMDTSTTHQIATAFTMRQADETLSPIRTAITRARGPLYQFLTDGSIRNTTGSKVDRVKLASTKKGIENFITNSRIETVPMSIDKLQSMRTKFATVDEWLSCDIREDVVGAIEQGSSKIDDYLIVAISSEGTVRNAIGDTIKMKLAKILRGEIDAPWISIWHYKLDSEEEVGDPRMWLKANPNLGQTVSYQTYQRDVDTMEKSPSEKNDIIAKRFGIPAEGCTYFFSYEETLPHPRRNFWRMPCSMGIDLSRGDDFCAFTFLFPLSDGSFGVKTRNYISSLTFDRLPAAMHIKYEEFLAENSLSVMDGTVLDMMAVFDDLDAFIADAEYDVRCVGYDPYNAKEFIARWESENGPFGIEKVIQGSKTESVPLGELKKLSEERMLLFDEAIMAFTMGHCMGRAH
ncbi:MAG: phage terminase family protein [Clostridiales bacterium]|nr:phage terminase family protein [Clostridiales bacterium]